MDIIKQLSGTSIKLPAIGQGIGEYSWDDSQINILRAGIGLGMNFIDTAEGYDNGHSEELIGKAVKGIRRKVIIGTKFSPEHNSYEDVLKAVEGSLRRLNTDYIDLYQMHWSNPKIPFAETIAAMEKLLNDGKVKYIGLGNIYLKKLKEAISLLKKESIATLQVEYNLFDRTIEDEIIPFCEQNGIIIMAYTPLDHGRVADGINRKEVLATIAKKYNKTPAQVALRWLIDKSPVVAIPKTTNIEHLRKNAVAADFDLQENDIETISRVFKRPCIHISPDEIRVSLQGEGNRLVYQTLEDAKENKLGYIPSPLDLAEDIKNEDFIKPVRLIRSMDTTRRYEYDLVEGRIRYWAWVIARGDSPIPAYIRDDWSLNSSKY